MKKLKKFEFLDNPQENVSSLRAGPTDLVFVLLSDVMVIDFEIDGRLIASKHVGHLLGKAFMKLEHGKRFAIMEKMLIKRLDNYVSRFIKLRDELVS